MDIRGFGIIECQDLEGLGDFMVRDGVYLANMSVKMNGNIIN